MGGTGTSKKTLVSILALAVVIAMVGLAAAALLNSNPIDLGPIITQGGSLDVINFDNRTIQLDYRGFDSSIHYSDCAFRISIGAYTSSTMGIVTWQTFTVVSDYGYDLEAYFVDVDDNGLVDDSDFCIITTYNVPEGLDCSIGILNSHTGATICDADFAF